MRLLNAVTLQLDEFHGDDVPEYAIFSHRWLDGEVSLQDLQDSQAVAKAGWRKIRLCCEQAVRDGLSHAWVDTCCIDKTSSAELTEAINSMYAWYRESAVCYAYLSDVVGGSGGGGGTDGDSSFDDTFATSAWFTRGWTLQELVAPGEVVFYGAAWERLGTRNDVLLTDRIAAVTGIDTAVLRGDADVRERSIAQRMSWAAQRTTTRAEDRAYSLFGLFGVNMPLLYGEGGTRAFVRLQEEIIKASDDQSVFAWTYSAPGSVGDASDAAATTIQGDDGSLLSGLLAPSPAAFAGCGSVVPAREALNHQPYAVTNRGLSLDMPMAPWGMETYLAALDCEVDGEADSRVGIYMRLQSEKDQYARVLRHGPDDSPASTSTRPFTEKLERSLVRRKVYVRQRGDAASGWRRTRERVAPTHAGANTTTLAMRNPPPGRAAAVCPAAVPVYGFHIRRLPMRLITVEDPQNKAYPISEVTTVPGGQAWDDTQRIVTLPPGAGGTVASIWLCGIKDGDDRVRRHAVKVGFDADFNPVVMYGGNLASPARRMNGSHSYEAQMHPSWMTGSSKQDLFRGDRNGGLAVYAVGWRMNVSLVWATVGRNKMWVLDIDNVK